MPTVCFVTVLYRMEEKMSSGALVEILSANGNIIIPPSERWTINLLPKRYQEIFVENFEKGPYTIRYYRDGRLIREDDINPEVQCSDYNETIEYMIHLFQIVRGAIKKY